MKCEVKKVKVLSIQCFRKNPGFLKVLKFRPLVFLQEKHTDEDEYGALVE